MNRVDLYLYAKERIEKLAAILQVSVNDYYVTTADDLYYKLCGNIQDDGQRRAGTIKFYHEEYEAAFREILCGYDDKKILAAYSDWTKLYNRFFDEFQSRMRLETNKRISEEEDVENVRAVSLWHRYAKGIYQGAEYLGGRYAGEKIASIDQLLENPPENIHEMKKKLQLIRPLKEKICGFGYRLCYNWIKECGAYWLAKPDLHIWAIVDAMIDSQYDGWDEFLKNHPEFRQYDDGKEMHQEERIALFMWDWAKEIKDKGRDDSVTAFKLDRIIYLYCKKGEFYLPNDIKKEISEENLKSQM